MRLFIKKKKDYFLESCLFFPQVKIFRFLWYCYSGIEILFFGGQSKRETWNFKGTLFLSQIWVQLGAAIPTTEEKAHQFWKEMYHYLVSIPCLLRTSWEGLFFSWDSQNNCFWVKKNCFRGHLEDSYADNLIFKVQVIQCNSCKHLCELYC